MSLFLRSIGTLLLCLFPQQVWAQNMGLGAVTNGGVLSLIALIFFLVVGYLLSRLAMGVMQASLVRKTSLAALEQQKPNLPTPKVVLGIVIITGVLFFCGVGVVSMIFDLGAAPMASVVALFGFLALLAGMAQFKIKWLREDMFAATVGTAVAWVLLHASQMMFQPTPSQDPFFLALVIVCVSLAWQSLFGPWKPSIKATVLGTFVLWIMLWLIWKQPVYDRSIYIGAILVAMLPAAIWSWIFLRYHRQRISITLLMFFAGMLSTAPILFYDALVKRNIEFNFFLFRVVPENFSRNSTAFITGNLSGIGDVRSTVATLLLSFMFVGFIEEFSKHWVTKKGGSQFYSSIVDVIQMAVIVAIGFAAAENVLNPSYFQGFLRTYIVQPSSPQWGQFIANVAGRSILTTMVHIVSTGIMGYFFGLSLFARHYLVKIRERGYQLRFLYFLNHLLRLPQKVIFQKTMLITSIAVASVVHGLFNFSVTLPSSLPGNPQTIGALFGFASGNPLSYIPILLVPAILYVVGGYWLIVYLLGRRDSQEERGVLVTTDVFVPERKFVEA